MDEATRNLLNNLRGSPTDLAKLISRIARRPRGVVVIPAAAIARWKKVDPESWGQVHHWLTEHRIRIVLAREPDPLAFVR